MAWNSNGIGSTCPICPQYLVLSSTSATTSLRALCKFSLKTFQHSNGRIIYDSNIWPMVTCLANGRWLLGQIDMVSRSKCIELPDRNTPGNMKRTENKFPFFFIATPLLLVCSPPISANSSNVRTRWPVWKWPVTGRRWTRAHRRLLRASSKHSAISNICQRTHRARSIRLEIAAFCLPIASIWKTNNRLGWTWSSLSLSTINFAPKINMLKRNWRALVWSQVGHFKLEALTRCLKLGALSERRGFGFLARNRY